MGLFRRQRPADNRVIDLTTLERVVPQNTWGMPGPCPSCGKAGYLDHIDPFREVMFQHCPSCLHKWEITRASVDTSVSA